MLGGGRDCCGLAVVGCTGGAELPLRKRISQQDGGGIEGHGSKEYKCEGGEKGQRIWRREDEVYYSTCSEVKGECLRCRYTLYCMFSVYLSLACKSAINGSIFMTIYAQYTSIYAVYPPQFTAGNRLRRLPHLIRAAHVNQ